MQMQSTTTSALIILSEVQDRLIAIFETKADKTKCQIYYHRTLICLSVTLGILLSLTKELHNNVLVTMPNSQNVAVILLFQQQFHLVMIFHRSLCLSILAVQSWLS